MKRKLLAIICIASLVTACLSGCANKEKAKEDKKSLDVKNAYETLLKEAGFEAEMMEENSESDKDGSYFEGNFGIRYSSYVDEYYYTAAGDGSPNELLIVSVKDGEESYVKSRISKYVEKRVAGFEVYNPTWTDTMKDSVVASKDGYVMLISGEKTSKVKAAFDKLFE